MMVCAVKLLWFAMELGMSPTFVCFRAFHSYAAGAYCTA
jgi:hypothetical protein